MQTKTVNTEAHHPAQPEWGPGAPRTLDDLAALGSEALGRLYRGGELFDLRALNGAPTGRMLTLAGPLGRPGPRQRLASLARSSSFPWKGKSFQAASPDRGEGINRVVLLGDKYRFLTSVEASAIDGSPCVFLNYDLRENPFFIRAIRDELRQVGPALFLGPAMLGQRDPSLVLWFGIAPAG
jgi:hypothetical protein